jgi:hypothetical protein
MKMHEQYKDFKPTGDCLMSEDKYHFKCNGCAKNVAFVRAMVNPDAPVFRHDCLRYLCNKCYAEYEHENA